MDCAAHAFLDCIASGMDPRGARRDDSGTGPHGRVRPRTRHVATPDCPARRMRRKAVRNRSDCRLGCIWLEVKQRRSLSPWAQAVGWVGKEQVSLLSAQRSARNCSRNCEMRQARPGRIARRCFRGSAVWWAHGPGRVCKRASSAGRHKRRLE